MKNSNFDQEFYFFTDKYMYVRMYVCMWKIASGPPIDLFPTVLVTCEY